ncbi:unnamed protein product [Schistosoma curassoni]|uniref:Uncharacterized protein n=1 Tax=Schistosoma curassoni TaxID=6186 RepID=A0A183L1G8_9TREM|nr:unnamed protein product [Schistosoma curassoni]
MVSQHTFQLYYLKLNYSSNYKKCLNPVMIKVDAVVLEVNCPEKLQG